MSQVVVSDGVGDQAVVSNAVETFRQDVDEEASDELVGIESHGFVSESLFGPVIFVFKGDAVLILGDQSGVGDSDTVGITGEVSQYRLGSLEGTFGIKVPLEFA